MKKMSIVLFTIFATASALAYTDTSARYENGTDCKVELSKKPTAISDFVIWFQKPSVWSDSRWIGAHLYCKDQISGKITCVEAEPGQLDAPDGATDIPTTNRQVVVDSVNGVITGITVYNEVFGTKVQCLDLEKR